MDIRWKLGLGDRPSIFVRYEEFGRSLGHEYGYIKERQRLFTETWSKCKHHLRDYINGLGAIRLILNKVGYQFVS